MPIATLLCPPDRCDRWITPPTGLQFTTGKLLPGAPKKGDASRDCTRVRKAGTAATHFSGKISRKNFTTFSPITICISFSKIPRVHHRLGNLHETGRIEPLHDRPVEIRSQRHMLHAHAI